ncbi:MAG: hypothetical protein AB7E95_06395 [Kiritimatiellales bacterium]
MRKTTWILLSILLLLAAGLTGWKILNAVTELMEPEPFRLERGIPLPPLPVGRDAELRNRETFLPRSAQQSWFLTNALARLLPGEDSSYTNFSDIFRGNGSKALDLNSGWVAGVLFPDRVFPTVSMRIIQDPDTGEYRISGGSIADPATGLEAGYEIDPDSEERKATLQWKKSF